MRARALLAIGLVAVSAACGSADATVAPAVSSTTAVTVVPDTTSTTVTGPDTTVTTTSTSTTTTTLPARPITIAFTGDVLMHAPLWRQAQRNASAAELDDTDGDPTTPPADFTPMFADIEPLIAGADLAICHLETPIAPPGEEYSTHPRYGVPAETIDALAAAGFDHCSTASNHTFDRGIPALEATIKRFDTVGITQEGMARTPADAGPTLIDVDGTTIAHLSSSYGWDVGSRPADEPWRANLIDIDQLIADATQARVDGAQLVIASLHWGNSGSPVASEEQVTIAQALADSGMIDLVVGHHAHVVQPIEQVGVMWVAYGLANFISNLPTIDSIWGPETQDGVILTVEINRAGDAPAVSDLAIVPTWVDKAAGWIIRDVHAGLADPDLARIHGSLEQSLSRASEVLADWISTK